MSELVEFPETTWGMLCGIRAQGAAERRSGMEKLCLRYRAPIARYARAAWARGDADAEDLTQEFFLWLLGSDALARFAPELGSFRAYLKGVLRNFGRNRAKAERAQKRGGKHATVSLIDDDVADDRAADAEAAFDRAWAAEVMSRAVERTRARLGDARAEQWEIFESYDLTSGAKPTYAELAARLGLKESDVRNALFAVREKVRAEVRAELCDTVATPRDLEAEWRSVVGA
jgi:RNA polymerase sigma-70 factor (ECF subfamily)